MPRLLKAALLGGGGHRRAGVRSETIESMTNVDQLDLLDPDRAVIVTAGTDLRIVPLP